MLLSHLSLFLSKLLFCLSAVLVCSVVTIQSHTGCEEHSNSNIGGTLSFVCLSAASVCSVVVIPQVGVTSSTLVPAAILGHILLLLERPVVRYNEL